MSKPAYFRTIRKARAFAKRRSLEFATRQSVSRSNVGERLRAAHERLMAAVEAPEFTAAWEG